MSIVVKPTGLASLYGQAAKLAGEGKAAQIESERRQAAMDRAWQIKVQQERDKVQRELQLQDMQHEEAMRVAQEQRAREWELEKMQIRSRLDFEQEEKERQKKQEMLNTVLNQIDETDWLTPEVKEKEKFKAKMRYGGVEPNERAIYPELYQQEKTVNESDVESKNLLNLQRQMNLIKNFAENKDISGDFSFRKAPLAYLDPETKKYTEVKKGTPMWDLYWSVQEQIGNTNSPEVSNTDMTPASVSDFENTVAKLAQTNRNAAEQYYNKYKGMF